MGAMELEEKTVQIRDDFDPDKILASGQCFRPRKQAEGWYRFVSGRQLLYLRPLRSGTYTVRCEPGAWDTFWHGYFDLGRSYAALRGKLDSRNDFLQRAMEYGRGIRVLRQDEWEMLVSFIISQRKSIPAIRRAVELLSERFGERLGSDGEGPVYAFPTAEALCCAGEQALQKKAEEKAARKLPELSDDAKHTVTVLRRAKEYLDAKPELSNELSAAQRRKRAQLKSKPVYRYVALAIFLFGTAAAAYGLYAVFTHTGSYGVYFALFGFAAIFLFSSYNMLPTAHNNNSAIMKRADQADAAMAEYVKHYPNGSFPVPSCYAHPIVLKRMIDAVEEGQAVTTAEALDAVKARLQAVNADVQVEQEEYDEIVAIKALFLNHDYQ